MFLLNRDPWILVVYRTYSSAHNLYLRGRALEDQPLKHYEQQTLYQTLRNTWRTFRTDEIRNALVVLTLPDGTTLETRADHEGYFLFKLEDIDQDLTQWVNTDSFMPLSVRFDEDNAAFAKAKKQKRISDNHFSGSTLIPTVTKSTYGIISDIDDTIMHTGVTSFLKIRVALNTFFKNYDRRLPLKGAAQLYQLLHKGSNNIAQNPMFYVSNSPWNLYRYLEKFLDFHGFPKGAILLRDFPTPWDRSVRLKQPHKLYEIIKILQYYPHLNFILLGDSGEYDVDYYSEVAQQFPDRIMAIYLRSVDHHRKMSRVQAIADAFTICPMLLIKDSSEALDHAQSMGWI